MIKPLFGMFDTIDVRDGFSDDLSPRPVRLKVGFQKAYPGGHSPLLTLELLDGSAFEIAIPHETAMALASRLSDIAEGFADDADAMQSHPDSWKMELMT